MFSCRSSSNSLAGNAGSRRTSAASASDGGKVLADRLDGEVGLGGASGDGHAGLQPVELVLDLLARVLRRPAHEHVGREIGHGRLVEEALLVAEAHGHRRDDDPAARLLGQQRDLQPARKLRALRARLDVRGRRVEGLAGRDGGVALVVLDRGGRGHRRRDLGAVGLGRRDEDAEGAVGRLQVRRGGLLHVLDRRGADAVPVQEKETPVALADVLGEVQADAVGAVQHEVDVLQQRRAGAVDFFLGDGRGAGRRVEGLDERRLRAVHVLVLADFRVEDHEAGVVELHEVAADRGGLLRLDERLVEAARGRVGQDLLEQVDRARGRIRPRRHVVRRRERLDVAHALERHGALAVLRGVERVEDRQRTRRLRDLPEDLVDELERLALVELAGDEQHRVVGLVERPVEVLEAVDRHVLEVGLRTDRGLAVVVPEEGGREDALLEDRGRVVFAHLELVADDGHLAVEVFLRDVRVDHPVGLEIERPLQVHVGRAERLEVVRAVEPGRPVGPGAVGRQLLRDVGMVRRSLEDEVLEQVGHSGLAVVLVARAHLVGDVDRDRRLGRIGEEEHAQAVGKPVLGDALDRRDLHGRGRGRRGGRLLRRGGRLGRLGRRERGARRQDDREQAEPTLIRETHAKSSKLAPATFAEPGKGRTNTTPPRRRECAGGRVLFWPPGRRAEPIHATGFTKRRGIRRPRRCRNRIRQTALSRRHP